MSGNADVTTRLAEAKRELRTANFHRDKLAERLYLVETAVLELDSALKCLSDYDPEHWRSHVRSALDLCTRATKKRADTKLEAPS